MRRAVRSASILLAATALLAVGLVAMDRARAASAAWSVGGWWLPSVAAAGEPVLAFVEAACDGCARPLVQMRVCAADGPAPCDLAARVPVASPGVTRVRYPRALAPGAYRVEVLLLDLDRWGAVRTRHVLAGVVAVR